MWPEILTFKVGLLGDPRKVGWRWWSNIQEMAENQRIDTQNSHVWKEMHFPNNHFWYQFFIFWGCTLIYPKILLTIASDRSIIPVPKTELGDSWVRRDPMCCCKTHNILWDEQYIYLLIYHEKWQIKCKHIYILHGTGTIHGKCR